MGLFKDIFEELTELVTGENPSDRKKKAKEAEAAQAAQLAAMGKAAAEQRRILEAKEAEVAAAEEADRKVRSAKRKRGLLAYADDDAELLGG